MGGHNSSEKLIYVHTVLKQSVKLFLLKLVYNNTSRVTKNFSQFQMIH